MSVNKFGNLRARMQMTLPILDSDGSVTYPDRGRSVNLGVVWSVDLGAAAASMESLRKAIRENHGATFSDQVFGKFTVEL